MSLIGWFDKEVEGFRGAWSRMDGKRARPSRAQIARNVRFEPKGPITRDGHSSFLDVSGKVTSMYNWVTSSFGIGRLNRLIYFVSGTTLVMRDLINNATVSLFTLAGRAASVAEAGNRLYASIMDTNAESAGEARVVHALIGGAPSDKAFSPPMIATPIVAETGAGDVDAGEHLFAYLVESRSGFPGTGSPVVGSTFTPVAFTVGSGGKALSVGFTSDIPDWAAYVHPIMTTIDNPNEFFFVPDASVAVPGGASSWPVSTVIDISDADLGRIAVSANKNLEYLTQDTSGDGPIEPSVIVPVGRRLAYFENEKIYVSDVDDFEVITEDEHVLYLPGRKQVVTGFSVRGSFYVFGPSWTYAFADNKDTPVTWPTPFAVSESQGTTAPFGVSTRTSGDFGWVSNPAGLWRFVGAFEEMPISFMNETEWKRINWAVPAAIQVVDDVANQRVRVAAPLDAATEPTHILTWYYRNGFSPFAVDFTLDDFSVGEFSSIAVVNDPTTRKSVFLIGPDDGDTDIWQEDPDTKDDVGVAIDSVYETGLLVTRSDRGSKVNLFGAADFAISGAGTARITAYEKGRKTSDDAIPIELEEDPDEEPQRRFEVRGDNASIRIRTNAIDAWFDLSMIRFYWRRWLTNR